MFMADLQLYTTGRDFFQVGQAPVINLSVSFGVGLQTTREHFPFFVAFSLFSGYLSRVPRIARVIVPGCPHHVTRQGNNHATVFFDNEDRMASRQPQPAQTSLIRLKFFSPFRLEPIVVTVESASSLSVVVLFDRQFQHL